MQEVEKQMKGGERHKKRENAMLSWSPEEDKLFATHPSTASNQSFPLIHFFPLLLYLSLFTILPLFVISLEVAILKTVGKRMEVTFCWQKIYIHCCFYQYTTSLCFQAGLQTLNC